MNGGNPVAIGSLMGLDFVNASNDAASVTMFSKDAVSGLLEKEKVPTGNVESVNCNNRIKATMSFSRDIGLSGYDNDNRHDHGHDDGLSVLVFMAVHDVAMRMFVAMALMSKRLRKVCGSREGQDKGLSPSLFGIHT